MRFLTIFAAAIIALISVIWLIGMMLPTARVARIEGRVAAPPAAILATIRAVEDQPQWRADVARVARTPEGWTETTKRGQVIAFTPEEMTEQRIRLRFASQAGFSGVWQADLRAEGGGTIISIEERVTTPSAFGRIMSRLFFNPQHFATTYLAELTARVEGQE
jgi:hypothetical protein